MPVDEDIVLGNYEIQFIDHEGKVVAGSQHVIQGEEIEILGEAQYAEVEEEESVQSDEDYKPPRGLKKKAKVFSKPPVAKKKKRQSGKPSTPLVRKDLTVESFDEHYFITIEADENDLDDNGEKKIFQCAFYNCIERFARRQACKTHYYNHLTTLAVPNGFTCKFCQKSFKVASALERHERVHTG